MIKMNVNQADYLIPKKDYDELFSDYIELTLKNERLQNNRNELKKWLEEYYDYGDCLKINYILKKMQELEQGKDEEINEK